MDYELAINKKQLLGLVNTTTSELINVLANRDDVGLLFIEKKMNLEKAINGTSIKKLEKIIDEKNLTKIVVFLINRLSSNFNVGKNLNPSQTLLLALDLIDVLSLETIEDVLLMFRMVRTGRIGDGKDFKLDSQTVFYKWIPQYLELKAEQRERNHNQTSKLNFGKEISIESVKKSYQHRMAVQKREEKLNARIDEITEGFNREQLEELITEWQNDKDKKNYIRYLTVKRLTIRW